MQIHELPSGTVTDDKHFAVDDSHANYKVSYAQLIQQVADDLGDAAVCDVADNLTTTANGKVLDAKQGKALKDMIDGLGTAAATDVVNNLTTTNAGFTLDARQGKALADRMATIETAIGSMNYKGFTVSSNGSRTFSVPGNYRGILFCLSAGSGPKGFYLAGATSAGVLTATAVLAAANVTLNTSTAGKLTVTNANSNILSLMSISFGTGGNITAD